MTDFPPDLEFDDVRNNHNITDDGEYYFTGVKLVEYRNMIIGRCEEIHKKKLDKLKELLMEYRK